MSLVFFTNVIMSGVLVSILSVFAYLLVWLTLLELSGISKSGRMWKLTSVSTWVIVVTLSTVLLITGILKTWVELLR